MRINPIAGSNYNSSPFKGTVRNRIANVHTEDKARNYFTTNDFSLLGRQHFIKGDVPTKRIETSYEPDIMYTGKVYFADFGEYTGVWAKETHSGVVVDLDHENLTMEVVTDGDREHSLNEIRSMLRCLNQDINYLTQKREKTDKEEELAKIDSKLIELEKLRYAAYENYNYTVQFVKDHKYDPNRIYL